MTNTASAPKIAALMSSYKRPNDLVKQILALLHQTYDCHIFVAVKGLSERDIDTCIRPLFAKEIEAGKLHLAYYSNKSQFNNILDCYRGFDIEQFDLYCKIDDDDIYFPTYLEDVAKAAASTRKTNGDYCGSWFSGGQCLIAQKSNQNGVFFDRVPANNFNMLGNTLCMSREDMRQLYAIEADPSLLTPERYPFMNSWHVVLAGFVEDALIHRIIQANGGVNRYDVLAAGNPDSSVRPQLITTGYGSSVTRGGLYQNEFYQKNARLGQLEQEWTVCLYHPDWGGRNYRTFRLFNGRATDLHNIDHAGYKEFDGNTLVLKWDKWGTETFVKNSEGVYCLK